MSQSYVQELIVLFSGGIGLLLFGCLVLPFASRWSRRVRAGASSAVVIGSAMIPIAFDIPSLAVTTAAIIVAIAGIVLLASAQRTMLVLQTAGQLLQRPANRAGLVGAVGLALVTVGFARFNVEDQRAIAQSNEFVNEIVSKPSLQTAVGISAMTDAGQPAQIQEPIEPRPFAKLEELERRFLIERGYLERVIRLGPSSDTCNCHGWVFTGGRYWVEQSELEHILVNNGYQPVSVPRPGDLAIYRGGGTITHTAVVRAVGGGKPVLVEGKWGSCGVFLHEIADSCWGNDYTFYRSPRNGHLLVGLGGSPGRPISDSASDTIADDEP